MNKQIALVEDFGLITMDGVPVANSRRIAEVFGKEHKDVLRAIENHKATSEKDLSGLVAQFCATNFRPSYYKDRGKKIPGISTYQRWLRLCGNGLHWREGSKVQNCLY